MPKVTKTNDKKIPIYALPNGGYKIRVYLQNPETGKQEQNDFQSKKWDFNDAKRELKKYEKLGAAYFTMKHASLKNKTASTAIATNIASNGSTSKGTEPLTEIEELDELFVKYIEWRKSGTKASYLETLKTNYNAYIHPFFQQNPNISWKTKDGVSKWQLWLDNKELKRQKPEWKVPHKMCNRTKNRIITPFRLLIKYANEELDMEAKGNFKKLEKGNDITTRRTYWKHKDWTNFYDAIEKDNYEDRALFKLLFSTGMRIAEARSLVFSDIDFYENTVTVTTSVCRQPKDEENHSYIITDNKGGTTLTLKLKEITMGYLRKLREQHKKTYGFNTKTTYLFGGAHPISANTARRRFNKYKAKMLKLHPEMDADVVTHGIRHSVCSAVVKAYGISVAQIMLGHKDPKTTAGYAHTELPDDLIFAIDLEEEDIELDYQI